MVAAVLLGISLYIQIALQMIIYQVIFFPETQSLYSYDIQAIHIPTGTLYTRTVLNGIERRNRVPDLRRPTVGAKRYGM